MKKTVSTKLLIIICAVLVIASAVGVYFVFSSSGGRTAEISVDGEIIHTVNLDTVASPYTLELSGNTLLIEREGITVTAANCSDKLCMHQGRLEKGSLPITCLPNRLVIRLTQNQSGIDAVAGR